MYAAQGQSAGLKEKNIIEIRLPVLRPTLWILSEMAHDTLPPAHSMRHFRKSMLNESGRFTLTTDYM